MGLATSALALGLAPALMPSSYSWIAMTTSESAAQGVDGAWLARTGFVLFGVSVALLAAQRRRVWGTAAGALHLSFGCFLVAAAVFSTRPWLAGPYHQTEDVLHSIAATAMGFAFAIGVVATLLHARRRSWPRPAVLDLVAVSASVLLPLGMSVWPGVDGALQRLMFLTAYLWYAVEASRTR